MTSNLLRAKQWKIVVRYVYHSSLFRLEQKIILNLLKALKYNHKYDSFDFTQVIEMDPNSIRSEGSPQDAVEVCGDTNNDDGNDDDRHFCIKCKQTIIGLTTYISHRRKGCNQVTKKVSFSFITILTLFGSDLTLFLY